MLLERALRMMQAAAVLLPPILLVFDAPFGKLGHASAWNVHGNGAWMAMEAVAPCALLANAYARSALAWPTHALVALFVLHYVNRAVYQPWRNPPRSPLHLSVVLSAMAFNLVNGTLLGTWLAHGGTAHHAGVWTIIGVALFALGLWGNMHHDACLRRLRIEAPARGEPVVQGHATYRIPRGALFEWVSYPNYLCECTSRHSRRDRVGRLRDRMRIERAPRTRTLVRLPARPLCRARYSRHATARRARPPLVPREVWHGVSAAAPRGRSVHCVNPQLPSLLPPTMVRRLCSRSRSCATAATPN